MWELLIFSIETGDLETIQLFIEGDSDLLTSHDPVSGYTALQWACLRNQTDIVKFFLGKEEVDINQASNNPEKNTALHIVLEKGYLHLIPLLLESRARVGIENGQGSTAVDLTIQKKYPKNYFFSLLQHAGFIEFNDQESDEQIFLKLLTTLMYDSQRCEWNHRPCSDLRRFLSYLAPSFPLTVEEEIKGKDKQGKATIKIRKKQVLIPTATASREQLSRFLKVKEQHHHTYFSSYLSEDSDSGAEDFEEKGELKDEKKFVQKAKTRLFKIRLNDAKVKVESNKRNDQRFKFFQLKERQSIEREEKNLQKIKTDLTELNKAIHQGKVKELLKSKEMTKFVVAQYRGINYFINKWNQDSRQAHRETNERGRPQYCEAVLKTPEIDFYRDFRQFSAQGAEFKEQLDDNAKKLKAHLVDILHNAQPFYIKENKEGEDYIYDNQGHADQDEYSKGILEHLAKIKQRRSTDAQWEAALPNNDNYKLSTSDIPYHALRYAYCLKDYYVDSLLFPHIRADGRAERPYVGKIYISLHPIEDYLRIGAPLHLATENKKGNSQLDSQIGAERETSFLSFLPPGRVFDQHVAKFPSFNKPYRISIHLKKYGLDEEMFLLFKNAFARYAPHTRERVYIERLLAEWLCAFHEVRLLENVVREARNQIVVYRNQTGGFSLDPVPVVPPSSDKSGWKAINVVRDQREELAKFLRTQNPGKQKFTGEELRAIGQNPKTPKKHKEVITRLLSSTPRKKLVDPLKNHLGAYSTPKPKRRFSSDDDDFGMGGLSLNENAWLPVDYHEVNVPAEGNCLFWSGALSLLLPRLAEEDKKGNEDNNDRFNEAYSLLFGNEECWFRLESAQGNNEDKFIDINAPETREGVRNMLLTYDCQQHTPLLFEGELLEALVCEVFRNRVVDHMGQWDEATRDAVAVEAGKPNWQAYADNMRKKATWGGQSEIQAMSQILQVNIQFQGIDYHQEYPHPEAKQTIYIRHVEEESDPAVKIHEGNHYRFGLHKDYYNFHAKPLVVRNLFHSDDNKEKVDHLLGEFVAPKQKIPTTTDPISPLPKFPLVMSPSPQKPPSSSPGMIKYGSVFATSARQLHLKNLSLQLYRNIRAKSFAELSNFLIKIKDGSLKKELLNSIGPDEKELPIVLAAKMIITSDDEGEKKQIISFVKCLFAHGAVAVEPFKICIEQIKESQHALIDYSLELMISSNNSAPSRNILIFLVRC